MKRVLFVDDEVKVLDALRRMLRGMRSEWEMEFVSGGQQALEALGRTRFDVVVSDMRMPGMDGAQLLAEVRKCYPHVVRIILSGQAAQEAILQSIVSTHQYLSKPCDADTIKATVTRACALQDLLADHKLKELVAGMQVLPSMPTLYTDLMREMQSPDASLKKAAEIITRDLGMMTKILQICNSAYFALPNRITNISQAVGLLGLDTVKALVLSVQVFSQFQDLPKGFSLELLWTHSLSTGGTAKAVAKLEEAPPTVVESAFMAGLLHDVGVLALIASLRGQYLEVLEEAKLRQCPLELVELDRLGASHAEVGAYLLGLWGLSDDIVEAIAFHHAPLRCPSREFSPLAAVHVATSLESERCPRQAGIPTAGIDLPYLEHMGLAERLDVWRERCLSTETGVNV